MGFYKKITAQEAKIMMDTTSVTIVDVRTKSEYKQGHIPHAILVNNEDIGNQMPTELPNKNATLLVYCRSGVRSAEASQKLLHLGYTCIYDFGGILSWPYTVEKGD